MTPLLQLVERAVQDGFIRPDSTQIIVSERDPATLLSRLSEPFRMPGAVWLLDPEET